MLNIVIYQQLRLFLVQEVKAVAQLRATEAAIAQSERKRQENRSAHYRLLAYQIWRMAMGYGMILVWLLFGLMVGAIAGHNLLSRAVLCESVVCELLRLDGNKVRDRR